MPAEDKFAGNGAQTGAFFDKDCLGFLQRTGFFKLQFAEVKRNAHCEREKHQQAQTEIQKNDKPVAGLTRTLWRLGHFPRLQDFLWRTGYIVIVVCAF